MAPLRKLDCPEPRMPCASPEHNPPSHIYLEAGHYEYECPACGQKTEFRVSNPTL
jgi:hypothetical protein